MKANAERQRFKNQNKEKDNDRMQTRGTTKAAVFEYAARFGSVSLPASMVGERLLLRRQELVQDNVAVRADREASRTASEDRIPMKPNSELPITPTEEDAK